MGYAINIIVIYTITPVFLLLGLYLVFKTKQEYINYQKRSVCTSVLCLIYHDLYPGLASYSAWYSTWPFFNLNTNFYIHVVFFILGIISILIGFIIYTFYLFFIKSFLRAIGRNSDELITNGIYSISRNPQSLARDIGLIGLAIMGRSFFTLFLAISWIVFNHFIIRIEEKYLENKFGESYLEYCSLTPRYFKIIRNNEIKQ